MLRDIQHIFFDLDRTLWDFERNSAETLGELFEELQLRRLGIGSAENFIQTYVCKNDHCWELYRLNQISKAELRTLRFRMALEEFGLVNHALAEEIGTAYVERSPYKTGLFPNTVETLRYLSEKYTLHIITNGFEEVQFIKMEQSGIRPFFRHVTTSERAGCKKPDSRIFRHAMAAGNAYPHNSLMIGDDIQVDVLGAMNAGMKGILFRPTVPAEPSHGFPVIRDLSELRSML